MGLVHGGGPWTRVHLLYSPRAGGLHVRYKAYEVLDYFHGNFAIPENGFEFDIEGFESDNDDDNDDLT